MAEWRNHCFSHSSLPAGRLATSEACVVGKRKLDETCTKKPPEPGIQTCQTWKRTQLKAPRIDVVKNQLRAGQNKRRRKAKRRKEIEEDSLRKEQDHQDEKLRRKNTGRGRLEMT